MKPTVELLEALLCRGWMIRGVNDHIEYRCPDGLSGSMYHADDLTEFPDAVAAWIWANVPMVPASV